MPARGWQSCVSSCGWRNQRAYALTGVPEDATVYLLNEEAGAALHASSSETIPPGAPVAENFEVYHWPLKDDNDPADLWRITARRRWTEIVDQPSLRPRVARQ